MALFKFVKAALNNEEIEVYNNGEMLRDFTYIDDIKDGVLAVIDNPAASNMKWEENNEVQSSSAPYKIYNIGNNKPVKLMDFIEHIEKYLNLTIKKNLWKFSLGMWKKLMQILKKYLIILIFHLKQMLKLALKIL